MSIFPRDSVRFDGNACYRVVASARVRGVGGIVWELARAVCVPVSISLLVLLSTVCRGDEPGLTHAGLSVQLDPVTGLPARLETRSGAAPRSWLTGPLRLTVRNEVSDHTAQLAEVPPDAWHRSGDALVSSTKLDGLPLTAVQRWSPGAGGIEWRIDFHGEAAREGHEVILELPILDEGAHLFTPTERGVMEVATYPNYQGLAYGTLGWETGQAWVLPLASAFDPVTDQALTIALPADANIPHLQFAWKDGKVLRMSMGHRGMGGDADSSLSVLFFTHAADYRAVLRAYSGAFPSYFRSPMPRGPYEGTFWYHHIHDHPDPQELARQSVRYIWSSFWFTHLGEYLPDASEWEPYTYAKWWNLGQTMSDMKIREFVRSMHERGIGTYAYFNVTEYGGAGGKSGDTAEAARILRERFANALVKDADGNDIPTWEGAMAMNPGHGYSLWPFLEEQLRRHIERLPEIDGFVIDRLDWASRFDYAHDDGLSMIGARAVENLAMPVSEAVYKTTQIAHAAGKRVFVNQFYRVEMLRDVDGVCHENDYLPALGYLIPLRPASAWHQRKPYQGDLLLFEAQLKQRLHWALFPQMIAHEFPISQQAPNPRAADLLELYATLFDTLLGKEQVLSPHCVDVTGANDANLFVNSKGDYVVPITSRTRFISRSTGETETITVTLRVPDAENVAWATTVSPDGPPRIARISRRGAETCITVEEHATATVLVAGKGVEPVVASGDETRCTEIRSSLRGPLLSAPAETGLKGDVPGGPLRLRLTGTHLGAAGPVIVMIDQATIGRMPEQDGAAVFDWVPPHRLASPPTVELITADDGTWFVPERLELVAPRSEGGSRRLAIWQSGMGVAAASTARRLGVPLIWNEAEIPAAKAQLEARDTQSGGQWKGRLGQDGVWMPGIADGSPDEGYRIKFMQGTAYHWPAPLQPDSRVLQHPRQATVQPTCWFADDTLSFRVVPADSQSYRLTLYVLDYDRDGRASEIVVSDEFTPLSVAEVSAAESVGGVYLTWQVTGPVTVQLHKKAGHNVVLSGVFVQ